MFEILDHPADIGFRVWGQTPAELFENAAVALLSIAAEPVPAEPHEEYPLEVEGSDYESLLVNWLGEVLWWFDGKRIAFHDFKVRHIEPQELHAVARGEPRNPERHRSCLMVKAVTYHQLRVAPENDGWVAEVYLDI